MIVQLRRVFGRSPAGHAGRRHEDRGTIRRRIGVGFGVVVLLLALVAIQSNLALRGVVAESQRTLERSRHEYDDAQLLVTAMLGEVGAAMQYVNTGAGPDDARLEARSREVDSLRLEGARLAHLSPAQRVHMELIGRLQGQLEVRIGIAKASQILGDTMGSRAALDTAATELAALDTALASFRAETASRVAVAERALRANASRAELGVAMLSIAAFLFAVAFAVTTSRAVAAPLDALVSHARAMSRGDFLTRSSTAAMPGDFAVLGDAMNHAGMSLAALEAELTHRAYHDPLTGLANRARFCERGERGLAEAMLAGAPHRVAVLMIDLDGFKAVNDTLGHGAGDALLRQVAARLLDATRGSDIVARLGGDEFGVVLENVRVESDAVIVAERIGRALRAPFDVEGSRVAIGASIGIARCPRSEDLGTPIARPAPGTSAKPGAAATTAEGPEEVAAAFQSIQHHADLAMYHAKANGKDRHVLFDPSLVAA
jgi:diguanylate cyclase (GGDEF)-like protein